MRSGAAGTYVVTLLESQAMDVDLPIGPGQNVLISGDPSLAEPPSWGSGGFTVQPLGSLALTHVALLAGDDGSGGQLVLTADAADARLAQLVRSLEGVYNRTRQPPRALAALGVWPVVLFKLHFDLRTARVGLYPIVALEKQLPNMIGNLV